MTLFDQIEERSLKPLRGRQIPLIDRIIEAVREGHKRIMVMAPCGFGKTVVSAHLMSRSVAKGKRPIFIAPAIALVEQTLASFEAQGIRDIGVMQADHARTDHRAQVQIASRDTLVRRALPDVDFVNLDEAHDQREKLNQILGSEEWRNKIVVGFSATPWTKGLGLHWSKLIIASTMKQMIEEGWLSPFRIYGVERDPDTSKLKTVNGDFQEAGAAKLMSENEVVGDAVQTWLKYRQTGEHPGDRTFLYGVNRAHAKCLMEAFNAQGVACGYIDGESSPEERLRVFKRYRSREDKVLANVGVLVTGVDEDVRCIQDCALTKSDWKLVQRWGRGSRLADGKEYCLGLDQAGNCTRLGLPEDIHHETLDMRSPKDKSDAYADEQPTPKPRKCGNCFAIIPPRSRVCPSCGFVPPVKTDIVHVPGELALLGSKPKKAKKDEKQIFYSGLLAIAQERGYKPGWAAQKYRSKFSVWPRGLIDLPVKPTKAVRDFDYEQRKQYLAEKKGAENVATQ